MLVRHRPPAQRLARWIFALFVLCAALTAAAARAQQPPEEDEDARPPPTSDRVEFNLDGGSLPDLVRMMTRITNRRFIMSDTRRTITASVSSASPVTPADAYRAFLAILHQNGLTVVRRGRYEVIMDAQQIGRRPTDIYDDASIPPSDDRYVTWIHRMRHASVTDAAAVLETLRSADGQVITYASTQSLIVIDTGANIHRMRRILAEIDVPRSNANVWIEPLHYAQAEEAAQLLRDLFTEPESATRPRAEPGPQAAQPATTQVGTSVEAQLYRVLPEPRTNSLVLVATEAGYRRALAVLREIDRPGGPQTTVHVYRLQHGDAERVAATLSSLLQASAPAATAGAQAPVAGLRDRVRVEAHADLNALVITSTATDYRTVRELILELDAPPRQVFLEMVMMELDVDHQNEMNVNLLSGLAGLFGSDTLGLIGGGGGAIDAATQLVNGITFGVSGPTISDSRLPGQSAPTLGVLVHALAASRQANIISTPSIMVLENREATINVGQDIPLQGSSVPGLPSVLPGASATTDATSASAVATAMSASAAPARRNVGTIVKVTPHINDDGEIRLEIDAEDSRAGDVVAGNLSAVALHQSRAQTELVVRDGQSIVIGGLMRDSYESSRSGVPVLSEIPILGALFGETRRHTVRRNLLFIVTPYIVRGPRDLRAIYERRMRERREFLDRHLVFEGDRDTPADYSRTRGLVLEMLNTVSAIDADARAAIEIEAPRGHDARPPIGDPASPGTQ